MVAAETPARIEPMLLSESVLTELADLAVELQREADALGRGLHADSAAELADLVRMMNCYYSNLVEGHYVRPMDIERALQGDELDPERHALALEARAHVEVQREIDALYLGGKLPSPGDVGFLKWIHRRFYEEMPAEFSCQERDDGSHLEIVPGEFRSSLEHDVTVGKHVPPSSERVRVFMDWFSRRVQAAEKQASQRIISIASAHHRFNYIHPFPDGNGRVSRLMSHAMALKYGIGGNGLWSISRGLARGLKDRSEYKQMMDYADSPRRGSLDGRGNLSEKALKEFSEWFLTVCLDQIRFSALMFDLARLEERYRTLVRDVTGDPRAPDMVSAVLRYGSLPRGDAPMVLRVGERTARTTLNRLVHTGFMKSDTPKGPVRAAFALDYRERLFPNLFTDAPVEVPEPPSPGLR